MESILKDKKQGIKSILRLMSINQQIQETFKQPQIDLIRKKLKILGKVNQTYNGETSSKQKKVVPYKKLNDILQKVQKEKKKKIVILEEIKNEKNLFGKEISIDCNTNQYRKTRTQYQQINQTINIKNKNLKKQSNFIDDQKQNIDMQKYLIIKSEKITSSQNILKRIRISYDLKTIQKQVNDTLFQDKIEENDSNFLHNYPKIFRRRKNVMKDEKQKNHNWNKMTVNKSLSPIKNISNQFRINKSQKNSSKLDPISYKYSDFIQFIGLSNQIISFTPLISYKFYICKGNNEELIRRLLKRRKWIQTTKIQQANFIWSPKREQKYYNLTQKIKMTKGIKKKQQTYLFLCLCKKQFQQDCNCGFNKFIKYKCFLQQNTSCELEMYYDISKNYKCIFESEKTYKIQNSFIRMHNHLINHQQLAYKRLLFENLKQFLLSKNLNPFQYIPLTFHIQNNNKQKWQIFSKCFYEKRQKQGEQNCFWIIKPAQNTNRGTGIKVQSDINKIKQISQSIINETQYGNSSVIIQEYIKPLLYNKRKFDIRCYALVTFIDKKVKVYWYQEGYLRTSSKIFNIFKTQNKFIHLTNDAIQKYSPDYGKYQAGNKISFQIISKYISTNYNKNFYTDIYPQMVKLSQLTFQSTFQKLHQPNKGICFEIFGLDFMIDQQFKVWLIEVNRNPCLETSTSLLNRIITQMLQNALRIALDPILSPSHQALQTLDKIDEDSFQMNKFILILNRQIPDREKLD